MKSLPLQMQQNLILAATLIAGVVFAPHHIEKSLSEAVAKYEQTSRMESAYGTATSLSRMPEILRSNRSSSAASVARPAGSDRSASRNGSAGCVPAAVQGEWHWNSNDSSSRFRFDPNGRYSYVYSVYQSGRGRRIESTTFEEGTVSFHSDGTFVMHPDRGHVQGNTGDGFVNRSMDRQELGERTFHWEFRGGNGTPQLLVGPSAKSRYVYTAASVV